MEIGCYKLRNFVNSEYNCNILCGMIKSEHNTSSVKLNNLNDLLTSSLQVLNYKTVKLGRTIFQSVKQTN